MDHTVPVAVVDRAFAHLLPHSAVPTAAVSNSAHTRPRASRLSLRRSTYRAPPDFTCRPRCRLLYCLPAAASLWDSKVVDPRQSPQCFSPTGLEFLPGFTCRRLETSSRGHLRTRQDSNMQCPNLPNCDTTNTRCWCGQCKLSTLYSRANHSTDHGTNHLRC